MNNNGQDEAEGNGECVVSGGGADIQVKANDKKRVPSKSSEPKPSVNKRDDKEDDSGQKVEPKNRDTKNEPDGGARADGSGKGSSKRRGRRAGKRRGRGRGKGSSKRRGKGKGGDKKGSRRGKSGKGSSKRRGGGKSRNEDAQSTGNAKGSDIMKSLAYGMCLTLGASLLAGLGVEFSTKHNAKYGLPDMYRMLLVMCCGGKKNATAEGQYQISKTRGNVRLPSRSWLLNHIRTIRHDFMLTRCQKMIRRCVKNAKRHGMLRLAVNVAIDEHDIPFHAKCMNMVYAVFSKGKKGTIRFNRIATVYCIVAGQQFTLGVVVVYRGESQAEVVGRLLDQCRRCNIRISTITMDRGFYTTGVMATVRNAGHTLIMPAVKHSTIKELILKFDAGELNAISEHTMSSGSLSESFKIIILRRKDVKQQTSKEASATTTLQEKQAGVVKKYYVFATTMPDSWIGGDPNRVSEFYKLRWGIENSYKSYEELRPWTTSNSHSVRVLWWFIPFVLYNLWMIARFITARNLATVVGRPPCALHLFVECMLGEMKAIALSGKPPDWLASRPPDLATPHQD